MSLVINNNYGIIHHIENSQVQIGPRGEIAPAKKEQAANETEVVNETDLFCRITQHAIETGHAQEVEDELRSASVSAPKLVKAIKTNEALGYLDTQNLTSQALYDMLNEHFGLKFGVRNFIIARNR